MGLRSSSLCELIFENCFLPETARLGEEGAGFSIALFQLDSGRIAIGAAATGIVWETIERLWSHGTLEEGAQQNFGGYFAELLAIRNLITTASELKDKGQRISGLSSSVKLLATELAMRVTSEAMTQLGMRSSFSETELERFWRDAKALQIVEGTNQIQRIVLATHLAGMMA